MSPSQVCHAVSPYSFSAPQRCPRGIRVPESEQGITRLGIKGVDLFLVDSTNAETPGFTTHEVDIEPAMTRVFEQAKGKLIVTGFASPVHRVQQVLDQAALRNRNVCYVGRSMVRNMSTARDLGYLKVPPGIMIELKDLSNYRDDEVVVISTAPTANRSPRSAELPTVSIHTSRRGRATPSPMVIPT